MQNENYISTYTIGQVIKKDNKYWQITKFTTPSIGDWFIADFYSHPGTILCCPSYIYFDNDDRRYIVQEVSITPVTVKVNVIEDKDNEKLPVGKIITFQDEFYEVIDYRVPRANEQYACLDYGSPLIYTRSYDIDYTESYNIVSKIKPYKRGQVIRRAGKSYTIVDYAIPKINQMVLCNLYNSPWIVNYAWESTNAYIVEPVTDPEATAYKPGQLIVRDGLVYRVIRSTCGRFRRACSRPPRPALHLRETGRKAPERKGARTRGRRR